MSEHWLSDLQLPLLGAINEKFVSTGVYGFNNTAVLHGRPYTDRQSIV